MNVIIIQYVDSVFSKNQFKKHVKGLKKNNITVNFLYVYKNSMEKNAIALKRRNIRTLPALIICNGSGKTDVVYKHAPITAALDTMSKYGTSGFYNKNMQKYNSSFYHEINESDDFCEYALNNVKRLNDEQKSLDDQLQPDMIQKHIEAFNNDRSSFLSKQKPTTTMLTTLMNNQNEFIPPQPSSSGISEKYVNNYFENMTDTQNAPLFSAYEPDELI